MNHSGKRLYIEHFCGLGNRIEILVLATAIQKAFGHEILLDWPELDALRVEGTRRGSPGLWGRWRALRLRVCDESQFQALADQKRIILRGFSGPGPRMASACREAAARLHLHPSVARSLQLFLSSLGSRPLIGIHLRQGDYPLLAEDHYDLHQAGLSAVPIWWHEWVMDAIVRKQPDARFLLCHNGTGATVEVLRRNFDLAEMPVANPYRTAPGHRSSHHPVLDLFALACCPVILATPISSFSHVAANVLGRQSICLVPPPRMTRETPTAVSLSVFGQPLQTWVTQGLGQPTTQLNSDLAGIDLAQPACTDWLNP